MQCPLVTQMHLYGSYGRVLRNGILNLARLESLELIEHPISCFLWFDEDADALILPPSLKRLCVDSVGRDVDDFYHWELYGVLEELVLRGPATLNTVSLFSRIRLTIIMPFWLISLKSIGEHPILCRNADLS